MIFQNKSSASYFESKYRANADPWSFAVSPYEQARYDTIMAVLSSRRWGRAFEPGCAVGVLTARLATICERVEARDFSNTAVQHARQRCAALPNVSIEHGALDANTSFAGFDLIVLSEIGYYFKPDTWAAMAERFASSMDHGATLLASHWTGHSRDHRISGDAVHKTLLASPLLRPTLAQRHEGFRLDLFEHL